MITRIGLDHPLRKLFSGMVEQVFQAELGICNPRVTDYVSGLLADFIHVDQIFRLHRVDGAAISEISRMEADAVLGADVELDRRRHVINRYIGDFTLFWTGVYPENLRPARSGADRLREYLLQGKRSYVIAGELTRPDDNPPGELYRQLGNEFEACVHGLHLVRSNWAGGDSRLAESN